MVTTITVKPAKHSWMVNAGVLLILYNLIFFVGTSRSASSDMFMLGNDATSYWDIVQGLVSIAVIIGGAIWCGIVASNLNRNILFWIIFGALFTPLALIILGLLDSRLANQEAQEIMAKLRSQYLQEVEVFNQRYRKSELSWEASQASIAKIREKYDAMLHAELDRLERIAQKQHDKSVIELVEGDGVPVEVIDTCPACGAKLADNDNVCPDCGLNLG